MWVKFQVLIGTLIVRTIMNRYGVLLCFIWHLLQIIRLKDSKDFFHGYMRVRCGCCTFSNPGWEKVGYFCVPEVPCYSLSRMAFITETDKLWADWELVFNFIAISLKKGTRLLNRLKTIRINFFQVHERPCLFSWKELRTLFLWQQKQQ